MVAETSHQEVNAAQSREGEFRLRDLLSVLKRVARQEPRVVLATFVKIDEFLPTEQQKQLVSELRWDLGEKRKTYRKFKEAGVNPEKALDLIEYLQNEIQFCSENDEDESFGEEKICKNYRYEEGDFRYICRLIALSDDPIQLVKDMGKLLDFNGYYSYPSRFIYHLAEYAESFDQAQHSPHYSRVISLIGEFLDESDKINFSDSSFRFNEQAQRDERQLNRTYRVVQDPVIVLSNMDQVEFDELSNGENIRKARELWSEISQGKRLRVEYIPELLTLANDVQLEIGFKEMIAYDGRLMAEIYEREPQRFAIAIARLKKLKDEVPELWDLLKSGFDISWSFGYPHAYDSDPLDVSQIVQHRYSFQEILANQKLVTNAQIVARYDDEKLKARSSFDDISDYKRYRYISNPETLEKSYIVAHSLGLIFKRSSYADSNRYYLWQNITETGCLDHLSIEQLNQLFTPFAQLVATKDSSFVDALAKMEPKLSDVIGLSPSLAEAKDRLEKLLSDKMQAIVSDKSFMDIVFGEKISGARDWDLVLSNLDQYYQLFQKKDKLEAKIRLLEFPPSGGYRASITRDLQLLFLVLEIPDPVLIEMSEEFASLYLTVNSDAVRRYISYRFLTDAEKQQLLDGIGSQKYDNAIKNIYDSRLDLSDLRKYIMLDSEKKDRVWEMVTRLETELHISVVNFSNTNDLIGFPLGFLCELALSDSLYATLENFISHVVDEQDDSIDSNGRLKCFRVCAILLANHQQDSEFNFNEYITPQGVPTSKLLLELANSNLTNLHWMRPYITDQSLQEMREDDRNFWKFWITYNDDTNFQRYLLENKSRFAEWVQDGVATHTFILELARNNLAGIGTIQKLITEPALSKMSKEETDFWSFWKTSSAVERRVITSNNERFSQLIVDGVPTAVFYELVAKESPEHFMENYDINELAPDFDQRTRFREIVLEAFIDKQTQNPYFQMVYRLLKGEIADRGVISEPIKKMFNQGYGTEVSEEFVGILDQFIESSEEEKYNPIIPDRVAFWNENIHIYLAARKLKWKIDGFERFRSLVQNPTVNQILSDEGNIARLQQVSPKIGLNASNIYYVNSSSLLWLYENSSIEPCVVFFRKILNEKPTSLNSCVLTFSQISEGKRNLLFTDPLYQERLIEAMGEFKNVAPSLIDGYVLEDDLSERIAFKEKINEFRRRVHRNLPILVLVKNYEDRRTIADMIALTFPGTNQGGILSQIEMAGDRCDDLKGLTIRDEGYVGQIFSREKMVMLREANQPIDESVINLLRSTFSLPQERKPNQDSEAQLASKGWSKLIKEAGSTKSEVFLASAMSEAIACVRVAMGDKAEQFYEMISRDLSQVQSKAELLTKAKELFGIYYKDNATEAIDQFLTQNPDIEQRLLGQLSPKRIQALVKNISSSKTISEAKRQEFSQIIINLKEPQTPEAKRKALAGLLAFLSERGLFAGSQGLRKKVENELSKLVLVDKEEGDAVDESLLLRGFVTKNAASFFAKTTAGICTAQDFVLYNRPDHFHINLVNQEGVVAGNIQGYLIEEFEGEKALIFRGFNPSSSIVSSTNAAVICDQMVSIVKQVAADNGIKHVLIPQQNNWHPLTNRVGEGVVEYFAAHFYKEENKVDFPFNITETQEVNTFYKIA